ncbi:MAG: SPASM domain-containing protein [Ruminiclostridium sp.]|nr:SPASM domain-containing protein [Ruminiclostridium sp.]
MYSALKRAKQTHMLYYNGVHYVYNNISGAVIELSDADKINFFLQSNLNSGEQFLRNNLFTKEEMRFIIDSLFYLPVNINEDKLLKERVQAFKEVRELDLIFALTLDCNFRCVYCFQEHNKMVMTREIADKYLQYFNIKCKEDDTGYLRIAYYGGEPLMQFDMLRYIHERIDQNFLGVKKDYLIITNGYLLTKEKVNYFNSYSDFLSVQVTIDGPSYVHDKRRPLKNGKGTFESIVENIVYCSEKINTTIRLNIDKKSLEHIKALFEELESYNLNKINITFDPEYVSANTSSNLNYQINCIPENEDVLKILKTFAETAHQYGYHCSNETSEFPLGEPKYFYCNAFSGKHLVLAPEGDMYACLERIGDIGEKIGNINESPIFNNRYNDWCSHSVLLYEQCRECEINSFCGGGCGSRALNVNKCLSPVCIRKRKQYPKECFIF